MEAVFVIRSAISIQQSAICNFNVRPRQLDPVSVADRLDVPGTGPGGRRGGGADVIDDTAQVAVADRLAVLAERNDGAVHQIDFRGRERETERLAARLHGVPAGVATEHEAR